MGKRRVPDILIEQYVLGELSGEQAREVERSEGFAERVAAIEQDNAAFAERFPAEIFAVRIRNQYESETDAQAPARPARARARTARTLAFAIPGAVALLVVGFVLFGGLGVDLDPIVDPDQEITRLKGLEPGLSIYRSLRGAAGDAEELADGSRATRGDRLQIAYQAGDARYGMIVSVDGRGAVTLHHPLTSSLEPKLESDGEQRLPYAYELDDAPDFEAFYFITSDEPFEVSDVLARVEGQVDRIVARPNATLQLPRGLSVETVTIRKGE